MSIQAIASAMFPQRRPIVCFAGNWPSRLSMQVCAAGWTMARTTGSRPYEAGSDWAKQVDPQGELWASVMASTGQQI